jgi:hypothetical protein
MKNLPVLTETALEITTDRRDSGRPQSGEEMEPWFLSTGPAGAAILFP